LKYIKIAIKFRAIQIKYIKEKIKTLKRYLKPILYSAIGGVLGYSYYYFVGCTGGCPLTSHWYITTGYGFAAGILMALPSKKKDKDSNRPEQ
jgi:hypothetical protein